MAYPSENQRTMQDRLLTLAKRTVPEGDVFSGAGIRLRAATATIAVTSAALLPNRRYKFRVVDAASADHAFRMVDLSGGLPVSATAEDFIGQDGDIGYLYTDGSGTQAVSWYGANTTGALHLMLSDEPKDNEV